MRLWRLQTDLDEERIGPAIAGRLKGVAFQYAMQLQDTRLDMNTGILTLMVAPEIFAEPAHAPWAGGGVQVGAEVSGATFLCQQLAQRFQAEDQDLQWSALESYFELFRGNASLESFLDLHDLTLTDCMQSTGLQMNDIGRSYFLLRGAQLTNQQHWDLRLRINGDL